MCRIKEASTVELRLERDRNPYGGGGEGIKHARNIMGGFLLEADEEAGCLWPGSKAFWELCLNRVCMCLFVYVYMCVCL